MFERFTDRARRVVVLAQEEARMLNHDYIGTEHLLLGLLREGDGVAAQVLVRLAADLNRVRQRVIQLTGDQRPEPGRRLRRDAVVTDVQARLDAVEGRLVSLEQRVGTRPDTADLDRRIAGVRRERQDAADVEEYERAASLRDQEQELRASKTEHQEQWAAGHPDLPALAEQCQELSGEIERLRALLREHGIDPQDKPA